MKKLTTLRGKTIANVEISSGWVTITLTTQGGRKSGAITMPIDHLRDEDGNRFEVGT